MVVMIEKIHVYAKLDPLSFIIKTTTLNIHPTSTPTIKGIKSCNQIFIYFSQFNFFSKYVTI